MSTRSRNHGFTIMDLLVVTSLLGTLLALLVVWLNKAREFAYRDQCQVKIKQIGLALLNHESAYLRFPLVFNAPGNLAATGNTPQAYLAAPAGTGTGASPGKMTGWSWIVHILPYIEEDQLYYAMVDWSSQFNVTGSNGIPSSAPAGPFDPQIINGPAGSQHCACVALNELICPAWSGDNYTNGRRTIDPTGAPEYARWRLTLLASGIPAQLAGLPAPTNYKAIVGTHLQTAGANKNAPVENGGMGLSADKGLTVAAFSDGLSKTLMVAETKECGYASWYDGTMNWVVTNWPSAKVAPGTNDLPPWTNADVAINRGCNPASGTSAALTNLPYLSSAQSINGIQGNENWGPSSDHANGAVMHGYGDAHVDAITDQVDPATYLNLTTRAGAESQGVSLVR